MQMDFHYYAIYCLARSSGIKRKAAQTIAYASQYVDDSAVREIDTHKDGSRIVSVATAHHATDIRNLDRDDQRYIWIPFHFLPGGKGNTWTAKLVCRKNSSIAKEMVKHNISQNKPYILELVGITAHVYSDTFSHYGFSGVSSRRNRIDGSTLEINNSSPIVKQILGKKLGEWFLKYGNQGGLLKNIRMLSSFGAEMTTGALGHGGVSIYPDQPYLKWSFEYEYPDTVTDKKSVRNNQKTYLEGSKYLHQMFRKFVLANPKYRDDNSFKEFKEIRTYLKEIFAFKVPKTDRIEVWKEYARKGKLYNKKENIPVYDASIWEKQKESFTSLTSPEDIAKMGVYNFFQAASFHKHYVLRELLPKHRIIVI